MAIKLLRPELSGDETFATRFEKEAHIYARIQSPYVVTIHDYGRDPEDGRLYLVMELLPGHNLRELILRDGPQPLPRLLTVARQLTEGLAAAHELGITHRDVKPENVIVRDADTDRPFAQLLDFGIGGDSGGQIELEVMGTPAYMSPEQALAEQVDQRSDLYALGVVIYEMACGRLPFEGRDPMDVVRRHIEDPPTPPGVRVAGVSVPAALEEVIMRCLQKAPADRYQSATELLEELDRVAQLVAMPGFVNLLDVGERFDQAAAIPVSRKSMGADPQAAAKTRERVVQALSALGKAYRNFALYPSDNPMFGQSAEEVCRRLDEYFTLRERLDLTVERFALREGDAVVFEDADIRGSYTFRLYADGVRQITFLHGLTRAEMVEYLGCLHLASSATNDHTFDLVTLMWPKRFPHIVCRLADELIRDEAWDSEDARELEASGGAWYGVEPDPGSPPPAGIPTPTELDSLLSREDRVALAEMSGVEAESDGLGELVVVLLLALRALAGTAEQEPLALLSRTVMTRLLDAGDWWRVAMLVTGARQVLAEEPPEDLRHDMTALIRGAGEEHRINQMFDAIRDTEDRTERDRILRLFTRLEPDAAEPVVARLHELAPEKLPKVQMALLVLCRKMPWHLGPGVRNAHPAAVRAVIRVLSEIPGPRSCTELRPALENPDAGVRTDAMLALAKLGDPRLVAALPGLLDDDSASVRATAVEACGLIGRDRGGPILVQLLGDPKLLRWDHDEQVRLYMCLAELGGDEVIAALAAQLSVAQPERLRDRAKAMVSHLLHMDVDWEHLEPAARALLRIDTPEARQALDDAREGAPKEIQAAIERLIEQHEAVQ